jgi:1-acyl-sn-glycerol-3-phosphate acyltransferase
MSRRDSTLPPWDGLQRNPVTLGLILIFSMFGVWHLTYSVFLIFGAFPIILLRHRAWDPDRFRRAVRRFIQFYGRMVIRLSWPLVRIRIVSRDAVRGIEPCVYVLNHFSVVDVYFCGFLPADQTVIAIRSWPFRLPVFNIFMRWAGYIDVETDSYGDMLERSGRALKSGASLLFFPEGHRSRTGRLQPLRKGAFHVAARNGVPVVPVTIAGTEYLGGYRSRLFSPCRVTLTFHPPLWAYGQDFQAIQALRHQVEDVYLKSVYRS